MRCHILMFVLLAIFACVNSQGIPTKKCPAGEHSVLYCPQKAEPSCDNPTVHDLDRPAACDIPQCFCNKPTVRSPSGDCVKQEDCPKKCDSS